MGIDLGGGDALMAQDHLKIPDVDMAVFVHERSGGMPELMNGIDPGVDPGLLKETLYDYLDHVI